MEAGIARGHGNDQWLPTQEQVQAFRTEVLTFFERNGRDLPWRRTREPYQILVSEMMLQQTQVARVLPYYDSFLSNFPDTSSLAIASGAEVLRVWQGLGYNRRAIYLKRCAEHIENVWGGTFPRTLEGLQTLPGVGQYTARAIASFAYEVDVAVVETNVRKAIATFALRAGAAPNSYTVEAVAGVLLPAGRAWEWNQAMIDFGAIHGTQRLGRPRESQRIPFESTDRFWRGRIMAALCRDPEAVSVPRLLHELPTGREEYRIRGLIAAMRHEGLVRLDDSLDEVRLP